MWRLYHLQVIEHVSHVPSVVQSVSVRLLRLCHLALVLQHVPQVSPGCRRHVSASQNKLLSAITKVSLAVFVQEGPEQFSLWVYAGSPS